MASRTDRNLIAFYRINLVLQGFLKNIPIESLQLLCGFGVANKGTTIPINLRSANTWPAAASNFGEFGEYSLFLGHARGVQRPVARLTKGGHTAGIGAVQRHGRTGR